MDQSLTSATHPIAFNGDTVNMTGPADDLMVRRWRESGRYYEEDLLRAILKQNRTGVYVDVGACLGNHSVFFSQHCPAEQVIAFEPNPVAYKFLIGNIQRNAKASVRIHPIAVAAVDHLCLVENGPPGNIGMAHIEHEGVIPVRRLDDVLWGLNIAVIKIDTEGCELEVLRGAALILKTQHPVLTVECATKEAFQAVEKFLRPFGYQVEGQYCRTPTYLFI